MECNQIKEIIPNYINHTASEEETKIVEEHLCICNACRLNLSQAMEKPKTALHETKKEITPKKKVDVWEFIILGIGVLVLVFFLYLFLKK